MTTDPSSSGSMPHAPILKNRFPFSIGTTSFMYPADWITNVRRMGHLVDDIELLFFDSAYPGAQPDEREVDMLAAAAESMDLSYHVHLPTDVSLTDPDARRRTHAVDVLERTIRLSRPLNPRSFTLHLPWSAPGDGGNHLHAWQHRAGQSLGNLLDRGVDPASLTVENLDYPMEWAWDAVGEFGVRMCMDVGHLLVQGTDPGAMFAEFRDHIDIIHLHGVRDGRDHMAVDVLDEGTGAVVLDLLSGYTGGVSLEVFRRSDWEASARWMLANLEAGRFTSLRTHSARG